MRHVARFLASTRFALVSAGQNLWRNLAISAAAVSVMWLILLMLGSTLLLTHMSDQVLADQEAKASNIKVYLVDGVSEAQVTHFERILGALPHVTGYTYQTKEQAAQEFATRFGNDALDVLGTNPLPASINLTLDNLGDVSGVDTLARTDPVVSHDRNNLPTDYNATAVEHLHTVVTGLKVASLIFGAVLGFISIVIIMVTVRTAVATRHREIEIMKLVGATDWFVRMPFVLEGVVSGIVAAALAGGVVALIYNPIVVLLRRQILFFPFTYDAAYLGVIVTVLFAGGILLGALGSLLGVRRFLAI